MKKVYFLLINLFVLSFLQGCGYEPVYSSKNFLFKVEKINYENNRINNQIARSLKSISNENAQNNLNLNLSSKKQKKVISKNKSGDPVIFELAILITIKIEGEEMIFVSKQSYNNNENKFELNEYENEIEEQLVNEIVDDILIFLAKY
tara:strand:- start:8 stop:451 length:444 start_codon:yes stop_codon:yes gene_type:complete